MKTWLSAFLLIIGLSLYGCGGGKDSLDGLGTFEPPDPTTPDSSDNDAPDNPVDSNTITVAVEATTGMQEATIAQKILDFFLPAKAYAEIDAGDNVVSEITVQQIDYQGNLTTAGVITPNDYSVFFNSSDHTYSVFFDNGIPSRLDLVIVAELSNGEILRRGLPNNNVGIRVNIATEYVVSRFFSEENLQSQQELDDLVLCEQSDSDCETQIEVHMNNWLAVNDSILIYDLAFPDSDSKSDALERIEATTLLVDYVSLFIDAIKEDKLPSLADEATSQVISNRVGKYNAVMLSLGLNHGRPSGSSDNQTVIYSNRVSKVKETLLGDVNSFTLPSVTLSGGGFGIIPDTLVELIPWQRHSLTQTSQNQFGINDGPLESEITCSSAQLSDDNEVSCIGGTFPYLSSTGIFDSPKSRIQTITQAKSTAPNGWNTNPVFQHYYSVKGEESSGSPSLASSFITSGRIYGLAAEDFSARLSILEEMNTAGWVFATLETEDESDDDTDGFQLNTLDFSNYGVVYFGQRFDTDPSVAINAGLAYWQIADGIVTQSSGPDDDLPYYQLLRRSDLSSENSAGITEENSFDLALASSAISETADDFFDGRLTMSDSEQNRWEGSSDPDGNIIALVMDSANQGQNIAIAVKASSQPDLRDASYRLYGNGFGISTQQNWLSNHNFSTLTFDSNSVGTLHLESRTVAQTASSVALDDIQVIVYPNEPSATPASQSASIPHRLTMEFEDPAGGDTQLYLEGFAGSNNNILVLILRYGDQLGLLYGYREQSLTKDSN